MFFFHTKRQYIAVANSPVVMGIAYLYLLVIDCPTLPCSEDLEHSIGGILTNLVPPQAICLYLPACVKLL